MKWFKHDTNARHDTRIKLLKKRFKLEGYAIYFQLLEIVGENIKDNNQNEWGFVEDIHSIDTLADEIGVTPDKLRTVLEYCNEIGLLHKIDGKLCIPKILDRLDEYARKRKGDLDVNQRKNDLIGQAQDNVRIVSGQTPGLEQNRKEKKRKEESNTRTQFSSLKDLTKTEFEEIAKHYHTTPDVVSGIYEELELYCQSQGKRYKDYKATLMAWVRRKLSDKPELVVSKKKIDPLAEMSMRRINNVQSYQ